MGSLLQVKSKQLEGVALYKWRDTPFRLDVWPFATAYASILLAVITYALKPMCMNISELRDLSSDRVFVYGSWGDGSPIGNTYLCGI